MSNGEFAFLHFSWKQNGWKCRVSAAVRELLKRPGVELAGSEAIGREGSSCGIRGEGVGTEFGRRCWAASELGRRECAGRGIRWAAIGESRT
ncbi:MAG: hypothetical protein ACI87A_001668, partial [Planctomycetota bacterium]